jgi:hypothetical protein
MNLSFGKRWFRLCGTPRSSSTRGRTIRICLLRGGCAEARARVGKNFEKNEVGAAYDRAGQALHPPARPLPFTRRPSLWPNPEMPYLGAPLKVLIGESSLMINEIGVYGTPGAVTHQREAYDTLTAH